MERDQALSAARIGFATLTLVAIIVQAAELAGRGVLNPVNFLSFFTIQSNLIGVAALLGSAIRCLGGVPSTRGWDLFRGASVLYLTITLIVFGALLSNTDVDTAVPWVNAVVHKLFPIVLILDWLIDPPASRLTVREALIWLAYPVAWLAYTLVRGPIAGWYPYPFLDPANGGYGSVAIYIVGIFALGVVVIAVLVAAAGQARDRWGRAA